MSHPDGLEAVIVERVDALRVERGLTWNQLAAACAGAGGEQMTAETLRKIIRGRTTRVRVNMWVVFALALDVPPLALLTPAERRPDINLTPTVQSAPASGVYGWLAGMRPNLGSGPTTDRMRVLARRKLVQLVPWLRSQPQTDSGIDPAAVVELVEDLLRTEPHPLDPKTKGEHALQAEFLRAGGMCRNTDCPVRGERFVRVDAWWAHQCTEHPGSVRQYNIMERLTAIVNPGMVG